MACDWGEVQAEYMGEKNIEQCGPVLEKGIWSIRTNLKLWELQ